MWAEAGVHIMQADQVAHDLMQPGQAVYREVVERFGNGILDSSGAINRAKLAESAFGHAGERHSRVKELNQIVHPAVIDAQEEWLAQMARDDPQGISVVEAALILEADLEKYFDRIVVVTCRPEQRIERWAKRTGSDHSTAKAEVARRMAAQFSEEDKIKAADYMIDNSGTLEQAKTAAAKVLAELRAAAALK
jgi:dephospho-CoA kinase